MLFSHVDELDAFTENIAIKKTDADVPYYTLEEVSRHNSESDCWVVLHGKVYDVTSFLEVAIMELEFIKPSFLWMIC